MTKMVGAAEFKAKCLALLDEVQATGEPITVTKRGKPVVTVAAAVVEQAPRKPVFGSMKGSVTIHGDLDEPIDPDWEEKWLAKWDAKLRGDRSAR